MPDLLTDNWQRPFVRSMLSERDGTASNTRFCLVIVVIFVLGFATALLWKIHAPVTVAEFCQAMGALGTFVTVFGGVLYGINRVAQSFDNRAADGPQK